MGAMSIIIMKIVEDPIIRSANDLGYFQLY